MIDIVSSTDKNYIMPTGVMMTSVCENNRDEKITFHVLIDSSVAERQKNELLQLVGKYDGKAVKFYLIDDNVFESYPRIGECSPHITKATYYRLFMETILPASIDKVLYVDSDIIITGSLADLWDTELAEHPVAAVTDMDEGDEKRYQWLGYPQSIGYFNAGVLLINLQLWRETNMMEVFVDFMKNHADQIRLHDQDVLNVLFRDSKLTLPLKYNAQNAFFYKQELIQIDLKKYGEQLKEAVKHPVIVHFTLPQKPWIIGCQHPYAKQWEMYRDMTPWRHRSIFDTLKYSGLRHTVGYYTRKWGLKAPMDNPYDNC